MASSATLPEGWSSDKSTLVLPNTIFTPTPSTSSNQSHQHMHSHDHSRDPCPYNIPSDIGVGFAMGAIGGSIWHGFKGFRNSPRGERLAGSLASIKARAPVLGGSFAVWTGLFNTCECCLVGIRKKEDSWNAVMSGAATGAILAARSGPLAIGISAFVGASILGVMEGINVMITKMNADAYKPVAPPLPDHVNLEMTATNASSSQPTTTSNTEPPSSQQSGSTTSTSSSPSTGSSALGGFFKSRLSGQTY